MKIKCSQCSQEKFVEMPIRITGNDGYKNYTTSIDEVRAYLCVNCGHLEFFSDKYKDDLFQIEALESNISYLYKKLEDLGPKDKVNKIIDMLKNIKQLREAEYLAKPIERSKIGNDIYKLEEEFKRYLRLIYPTNSNLEPVAKDILRSEEELCRRKAAFDNFSQIVK